MKLSPSQDKALTDLKGKLFSAARRASLARSHVGPEVSNTSGIVGPRGGGKSTLLFELYKSGEFWRSLEGPRKRNGSGGKIFVIRPIDCSVVPSAVAPGAAILVRMLDQLTDAPEKSLREYRQRLEALAQNYAENTDAAMQLTVDLASSLGDYTSAVLSRVRRRFALQQELGKWLKDTLEAVGCDVFLVLLDDFDLVEGEGVRRWINSLLDELRQERLLFVLTADYYRLEHLGFNPREEFDDKTGRSLVDKLIPVQNRCDLERWAIGSRAVFALVDSADQHKRTLSEFIQQKAIDSPVLWTLLTCLLPAWPRGLVNLYYELRSKTPDLSPSGDQTMVPQGLRKFLSVLASCRGEHLLARSLKDAAFSVWLRALAFESDVLVAEDWQAAVAVALERSRGGAPEEIQPLPLQPVPLRRTASEEPLDMDVQLRNPSEPDRLRHDELRSHPLQDAAEAARPYWSELLVSYSFLGKSAGSEGEAVRNRILFLEEWRPAKSRLDKACLKVRLSRGTLRDFFERAEAAVPRSSLLWMTWEPGEESIVEIGWPSMLSGLRGARDAMLSEQLGDLLIGSSSLEGALPRIGDVETLAFLPDELWAMIVLVDGLERCPWRAFSTRPGWLLGTYVQLAAVLVRSAYFYGLQLIGALEGKDAGEAERKFLLALETRDPSPLLGLSEEEMLALLGEVLADRKQLVVLERHEDSLSKAAALFLDATVYRAAGQLSQNMQPSGG